MGKTQPLLNFFGLIFQTRLILKIKEGQVRRQRWRVLKSGKPSGDLRPRSVWRPVKMDLLSQCSMFNDEGSEKRNPSNKCNYYCLNAMYLIILNTQILLSLGTDHIFVTPICYTLRTVQIIYVFMWWSRTTSLLTRLSLTSPSFIASSNGANWWTRPIWWNIKCFK